MPVITGYTKVLIFFHGVGGQGNDWKKLLENVVPSGTKLVLPTAPTLPVHMFGLKEMTSW